MSQADPDLNIEEVDEWIRNPDRWPTADSYDPQTLAPCTVLGNRENELRDQMPEWFWKGEKGSSILSIGTGKGYFERKLWSEFDDIYVIDPSEWTRRSLEYFSIPNARFISRSLFDAPLRLAHVPKYCWLGACVHYMFAEFYGWAFLRKLAMMVSDTLVIDAGVIDSHLKQGQYLLSVWDGKPGRQLFEEYRRSQFSYEQFRKSLNGLWSVTAEWPTTWVGDGRRTLILKRELPPAIQKDKLGPLELVCKREQKNWDNWSVFRTSEGYYKEITDVTPLLIYDAIGKMMGWDGFVRWVVYEEGMFCGFVVKDYGDQRPDDPSISEELYLALMSRCLPLGFLPGDVALENIRIHDGIPIWIDIDCLSLTQYDAFLALWTTTNTYKQYSHVPNYIDDDFYYAPLACTDGSESPNESFSTCVFVDADENVDSVSSPLSIDPNEAVFVSQLVPQSSLGAGQRFRVSITMKNTGSNAWPVGQGYRLGSQKPQDNLIWGLNRVRLQSPVPPGSNVTFNFSITSPRSRGDYNFQWQMVQDGVEWFGSLTTNLVMTVR